ncbi:3D domain-containing protein [Paenibacillus dauci]|uniref:3D domain-containing protein n=1 Tax=Paenibacillus dauci TaxID=1567106 RepID=UPI000619E71C|nr:3D domain-containing protein [Paenibacillus dauci]
MGMAPFEETHGSRSSSMSYALSWKQKNLRFASLTALAVIAVIVMLLAILYNQAGKNIYVVIDGKAQEMETRKLMLSDMLTEHQIQLAPQDKVSMPLNGAIQDGDKVYINHAVAVNITADGGTKKVYTTAKTVGNTLDQAGIDLKEQDKLNPPVEASVKQDMDIKVIRTTSFVTKQTVKLPYEVVKKTSSTMLEGKTKLVQSGQTGKVVQYIEKVYEDGEFVSKRMIDKKTTTEVQDKIVMVGTKKEQPKLLAANTSDSSSKSDKGFSYAKVLNNVTLTAYSSGEPGLGTTTASGTRVTEGRTIAVDTSVIPMGWWVYIEGIGYRRAEDTGSAINGNKIDVYIDSLSQARAFGRKTGYTVYVIGPVKP